MTIFSKVIYRVYTVPDKIPTVFLIEMKDNTEILTESEKSLDSLSNPEQIEWRVGYSKLRLH